MPKILHGARTASLVVQASDYIDAPVKQLITIPGTGHTPFLDQPEEFARVLIELVATD